MNGKAARNKGLAWEREIAKRLRHIFPGIRRAFEFRGSDCRGVDLERSGSFAIQAKNYRGYVPVTKIEEIKPVDGEIPLLISKALRKRPAVIMYMDDFITILEELHETGSSLLNQRPANRDVEPGDTRLHDGEL